MRKISLLLLMLCIFNLAWAQKVSYQVSFEAPQTHYCEVEMTVEGIQQDYVDLRLPVWAPGSYLMREFPKSVEGVDAKDLKFEKIKKDTWRVYTKKANAFTFSYKVYAFEHSVRTSFIDAAHASLNGTSIFMYVDQKLDIPHQVTFKPHASWKNITTSMDVVNGNEWVRTAEHYDILVDSPVEIGNHKKYTFTAAGIPHEIAVFGEGNYDESRFVNDVKKIVEVTAGIFGGKHPCKKYTFIVNNMSKGGGGLEHLSSTMLIFSRFGYDNNYFGWLSLVAHEYFHLWNVKRIRPKVLGPFDYGSENYTTMLWMCEGVTSYYDDKIVWKSDIFGSNYLSILQNNINGHERKPGKHVQAVAEASFDAWIKYYRHNENSFNTEVSYYTKGSIIAALLDIIIIDATNGKKSMDDLLQHLYKEYYLDQNRGFTKEELQEAFEKVAGKDLDEFFQAYIYGKKPIDYEGILGLAGIGVSRKVSSSIKLGVRTKLEEGKLNIKQVTRDSPAYKDGLNVNDELIAVDGYRVSESFFKSYMSGVEKGQKVVFTVVRDQKLMEIEVTMFETKSTSIQLYEKAKMSTQQKKVYDKWLKK